MIEKNLKSVPGVSDTNPFGGPTREYQVRIDPDKLVAYGLSIGQVEQQLANNNVNAGGSFIEAGLQQVNVREVGLVRNIQDIENTVVTTKSGTPLRVKDIAVVDPGPEDPAWPVWPERITARTEASSTTTTSFPGSCCCKRAPMREPALDGIHQEGEGTQRSAFCPRA